MPRELRPSVDEVRDLGLLIRAHHPLILVETLEEERVGGLLAYVAEQLSLPCLEWTAHRGLVSTAGGAPIADTIKPVRCLTHLEETDREALFHIRGFETFLEDPQVRALLKALHGRYFQHRGALVLTVTGQEQLPADLEPLFTHVELPEPTEAAYHQFISQVLRDLKRRMPVEVNLTGEDVTVLLQSIRGLNFFEVKKLVTQAVVEDGVLSREDLPRVLEAKKQIINRSGVLDYFPAEESMAEVAGLTRLKDWLRKRRLAFSEPKRASEFGLTPPRGLLLLGVQGCGKSLCAKAVAAEWSLPLIRLDPSTLYSKYYGESEKNLRRATRTAEAMAPIVLWIDEIEKAFGGQDGADSGPSQRIFGTFLTWLNDKKESVFVIATANDVSKLPPELLRKGRFDEIFFVDLPDAETREAIFAVHLRRRGRDPQHFQVQRLAEATEGFSGAEIEQVIVSSLYSALSDGKDLDPQTVLNEAASARPLSVTMAEKVAALRAWAKDRTVSAS